MVDSPTPPNAEAPFASAADGHGVFAVAYSGGRDSTALLHASCHAAARLGLQVLALHVHHGLSPHADEWLAHAERECEAWAAQGLPLRLRSQRLSGRPAPGESTEAWARSQRHAALARMATQAGAGLLLLAHHRRDQAETWLLQALRGAGPAGLAAMPQQQVRPDALVWARPWLDRPREQIEDYLAQHRLAFIDDDSNQDERYARNRLRLSVWPALSRAFPQAEAALARSARWAQEAADCLAALADIDLRACAGSQPHRLDLSSWQALSPARRSNALRAWLQAQSGQAASVHWTLRLHEELLNGPVSARWRLPSGQLLHRYRQQAWIEAADATGCAQLQADARREAVLCIDAPGRFPLPGWQGWLEATAVEHGGLPLSSLQNVRLAAREGGEQFQAGPGRPPRSLKKQYQACGIPVWQRGGPLLFAGNRLLFVPGLGMDARATAQPHEAQLKLHWQAD